MFYTSYYMRPFILIFALHLLSASVSLGQAISFPNATSDVVVCQDDEDLTIKIEFTNDLQDNPFVTLALSEGMNYVPSSILIDANASTIGYSIVESSISDLNKPIFEIIPMDISSGGTVQFSISRQATCEALDIAEISGVFTQKDTVYLSTNADNTDAVSDEYGILRPFLVIQDIIPDFTAQPDFQDGLSRSIIVENTANGYIDQVVHSVVVGSGFQNYQLKINNTIIPVDSSKTMGMDTKLYYTIDFGTLPFDNNIGDNDAFFEENETYTVQECFDLMGCTPSENFSEHQIAYQCFNSEVCRSSAALSESINLTSEVPFAEAGLLNRIVPTCPDGEDQGTIELYFTNTGLRGLKYNFSLGAFDDQAAIDTSLIEVQLKRNGSTTLESFDYEVTILNTNLIGLEKGCQINNPYLVGSLSIASANSEDPLYLALGDTLFVNYNYVLCCTEGDGLKTATDYGVSSVRFNYGDICGNINDKSIFLNPAYTDSGGFLNRASEPLVDSAPQILDNECISFTYEFSELLISAPFGSQAYLEVNYQLPIGLIYQSNSAQLLFGDVINNPMAA
ncbi:MAG: hypothetical protein AAFP82_20840, partial [Bacteroidota bacterium]